MGGRLQIQVRVNGKLYGSIPDAHRTVFIAAALDMLERAQTCMWDEHKVRADAIIRYARVHDLEALRKRFDEHINATSERQLQGAANCLYTALNDWCGYKPPSITLKPNLTARIIFFAFTSSIGYFGGFAAARFAATRGAGRVGTSVVLLATIAIWFFVLVPLLGKFIARKQMPIFLQELLFSRVIQSPSSPDYGVDPVIKARVSGQQYIKYPVESRTTFLVGALDMLSFAMLYAAPKYQSQIDQMIRATSAFKGDDVEIQFGEYLAANENLLQEGAASDLFAALDDWSKSGEQFADITQASDNARA